MIIERYITDFLYFCIRIGATLGSPANSSGERRNLGANGFQSKYEERDVAYTSELISEGLDFGIETLGRGVCRAILKVVGNGSVIVLHRLNYRVEELAIQPFHLVIPPSEFCQRHSLIAPCIEYLGQLHRYPVRLLDSRILPMQPIHISVSQHFAE